jgi:periplasmic protein TonB
VTSFTVGLTVGRGPLGKRLREAPKSLLATDAKPPALPDPADESTSRTPPPPAASSDDSEGAKRTDDTTPSEEKFEDSTRVSDSVEARSTDSVLSPTTESKPSAKPEVNSEHNGAIGPVVRKVSPPPSSKLVRPPKAVRPISRAPKSLDPYRLTSTIAAAPHLPKPSTILINVPSRGSQPFRLSFPQKTIAATSSLAMTSQLSVLVSPDPAPTMAHKSARLEAGELVSFGWPSYQGPRDRYRLAETIKVRATIGQLGQVLQVKFLGGSVSLLPATTQAIRQWRYRPTLLDKRPVQAEQDVTIEFRPPQYSSRLSTQHSAHN